VSDDLLAVDSPNPTFDARNQYYRIWMWLVAQTKEASVSGDWRRWLRCVVGLYTHAQSFFHEDERLVIEKLLEDGEDLLVVMQQSDRGGAAYSASWDYNRRKFEKCLNDAERKIYDGMKARNMLLPQSSQGDGSFDVNKLLDEADL
jgi:hypothetical protein